MSAYRIAAIWLVVFVAYWLVFWIADLIAFLHWTTPADWSPKARFMMFFGAAISASGATGAFWANSK